MAEPALARGASRYVEKGSKIEELPAIVREIAAARRGKQRGRRTSGARLSWLANEEGGTPFIG
jgi:hypothetical protein